MGRTRDAIRFLRVPRRAWVLTRALFGGVVLLCGELWHLRELVPAPGAPAVVPPGAAWLLALPRTDIAVVVLQAVVLGAAACVVVGLFFRATSWVLALGLLCAVGLMQLGGTPIHLHHLVWLSVLVALSPAGGRASKDARPAPGSGAVEDGRFLFAAASSVLGAIYFFPGWHKLFSPTSPFLDGDALARLVRLKAFEGGRVVFAGLDAHPGLLLGGGVLIIAVELSILPLALVPKTRSWAAAMIVLLHLGLAVLVDIPFTALMVFAPLLIVFPHTHQPTPRRRRWTTKKVAAAVLVIGVLIAGASGRMFAYPFSCYPTFAHEVPAQVGALSLVLPGQSFDEVPRQVWAPREVRTATFYAARRVRTAQGARRFVKSRAASPGLCEALGSAPVVEVWRVKVRLDQRPLVEERVERLTSLPVGTLCPDGRRAEGTKGHSNNPK